MFKKLRILVFPSQENNHKAKSLQLSSLMIILTLFMAFQNLTNVLARVRPDVLGYATDISSAKLLELTNKEREKEGLEPLKVNQLLEEAARQKASAMFAFGCWSHTCQDKSPWWFFKNVGYQYLYAGENLARDFAQSQEVVIAWMESPTHKDNILNKHYTEIGFAVVDGSLNGQETTLVVQLFGTPGGVATVTADGQAIQVEGEQVSQPTILVVEPSRVKPIISRFALTKNFSLVLVIFLIFLFGLDSIIIFQKKIARISGKSFIHLSFFIIILVSILLVSQGQIM